jgi:MFS family permease
MSGRLSVVFRVIGRPRLRRLLLGFGLFGIAEAATWIAVTVYAFDRGGVGEAGLVSAIQLAPAVLAAPFAAYAGDRFRIDVVLALGYLAQAVCMAATAAVMWADARAVVVYAAATSAAVAITFSRPAMGAVLPRATSTPADLTAANVTMGVLEYGGALIGPALAAFLLVGGAARVFAVMAGAMAVAALAVIGIRFDRAALEPTADVDAGDVLHDALGGFRTLRAEADLRLLILVATLSPLIVGVSDVLFVAVADGLLHDSTSRAGFLGSAFGLGAFAGAVGSVVLVGRPRLVGPLVLAIAGSAAGLALMAAMSNVGPIVVAFVICGAGESLARVASATLVPRFAPPRVLSRVYGVVEALSTAALALGAIGVAVLVGWWGLRPALLAIGVAVPVVLVLLGPGLRRISAAATPPDAAVLRLVSASPVFAGLGAPAMERLLAAFEPVDVSAGVAVVREGEEGDRYYLIEDGQLVVTVDGRPVRELGAGGGFGEIALLRDVPRTATISTLTPVRLHTVRRDDFLSALSGHPAGLGAADAVAQRWLDDDASRGPSGAA